MSSSAPTPAEVTQLGRLLSIVDVGADPRDGGPPYWDALVTSGAATVLGFEPQAEGLAAARAAARPGEVCRPEVLGDGQPATLRVCRAPGMTSLLAPDPAVLGLFHGFPQWGEVVAEHPVETSRLDDVLGENPCDLLKLDVQGGEALVLAGGPRTLARAAVVQVEVSFVPLYRDQPLFADLDDLLRAAGFGLHTFAALDRRPVAPVTYDADPTVGGHQLLQADAIYVRGLPGAPAASSEQLRAAALLLARVYGSTDLAQRLIADHDARFGTTLWDPWCRATGLR